MEELVSIHDSQRKPVKKADRKKGVFPYYGASGIADYVDSFIFDGEFVLLAEDGDNLRTQNTPIAFMANGKFWVNNHAHIIKGKDGNSTKYICYALQVANVDNYISGSTRPKITQADMRKILIYKPTPSEQKAIANILGTLDEKIELNRRMNATLEQMAQALFKSWFVDFDPVIDKALATGNPIPEPLQKRAEKRKALGDKRKPLPEDIQMLFPDEFEFSEELDRWVPKGWEVCSINEIAEVIGGGTPSTKIEEYYCQDGIPWLSPKDLSGYEWKFISKGATDITNLGLQKSSARLMPKGTVLFSSRAPIGYIAIAENEISTNQGFKSLVPKNKMASNYLFYFLKTNLIDIEAIATGSTFKEVSGSAIKNFKILIPLPRIVEHFEVKTKEFNAKQLIIQKEVESLASIHKNLLPKLISGKIRVQNNETRI